METKTIGKVALGLAAAATLAIATPASAARVIVAIPGGPFTVGSIPSFATHGFNPNTYDFTFTLAPTSGDVLSQIQASLRVKHGSTAELINFSLFSGAPGTGMLLDSTGGPSIGPSLNDNLAAGSYYLETSFIAANGELISGGLDVTAVPEPATWAMLLVGFGGLGAMVRSRRKVALAAA